METVVIKKMLYVLDESEKKLFFKEAALLNGLHPNIVKLLGVCHQPQAILHFSSASPRGGPRADVGTLQIVHFKVLVFPHPWGFYFLQSPQYLVKPSTQLASELYLVKISTFLPVLNSPDTVLNLSRLMKNKGETHYHDGSLLILNTTFSSFPSTLNGCCDAPEINILVKITKKINSFFP